MNNETTFKITNIKNSTLINLIEQIYKYNIDIEKLYNKYYIDLLNEFNIKRLKRTEYLKSFERLDYKYNQKLTTLLNYYENSKNRQNINNDTTEEQNNYLKKLKHYKNKLNKLNKLQNNK